MFSQTSPTILDLPVDGRLEHVHIFRIKLVCCWGSRIEQPKILDIVFKQMRIILFKAHKMDYTIISLPPSDRLLLKTNSHLGDLIYFLKAGPISSILGVHYTHFHTEMEIRQSLPYEPVVKNTSLGCYVIGYLIKIASICQAAGISNQESGCSISRKQPSVCSVNGKQTYTYFNTLKLWLYKQQNDLVQYNPNAVY